MKIKLMMVVAFLAMTLIVTVISPVYILGREDFVVTAAHQNQKDEVFIFVKKRNLAWSGNLMSYIAYSLLSYGIPLKNIKSDLIVFNVKNCAIKESVMKGVSGGQETIIGGELFYVASKDKSPSNQQASVEFWKWEKDQFVRMSKDFSKRMYETELGGSNASFKSQEGWHHYKSELYNYGGASSKESKFEINGVCDIYMERELDLSRSYGETLRLDFCGGKKSKILYRWTDKHQRVSAQEYQRRTSTED